MHFILWASTQIYFNIDLAIPYSRPRNYARPRKRPIQEYPGFVFLRKSSTI